MRIVIATDDFVAVGFNVPVAEFHDRRSLARNDDLRLIGPDLLGPHESIILVQLVGPKVEHTGVVIEKLHFQSKPGLYVTANLYRPKVVKGKLPAVLYVCGHSGRGRDGMRWGCSC